MIKECLKKFILFAAIDFVAVSLSETKEAFECLFSVCFPYSEATGSLKFTYFSLNICLCLIFVSTIVQSVCEQFLIGNYILTRTNRKKAINKAMYRTVKDIFVLLVLKGIADLLFGNLRGEIDFNYLISVIASLVLTLLIWVLLCYFLQQKHVTNKMSYFSILLLIILSQCFAGKKGILALFVFGSEPFSKSPMLYIIFKLIFAVSLYLLNVLLFNKYEHVRKNTEM